MKTNLLFPACFLNAATIRRRCLLFLFLFLLPYLVSAQQPAPSGTDFWFSGNNPGKARVYIYSDYTTTGKIVTTHNKQVIAFSLTAGESKEFDLSTYAGNNLVDYLLSVSVHITSEKPIQVSVEVSGSYNRSDISPVYPTSILGYEYYTLNHDERYPYPGSYGSSTIIVATEDNTLVEITPTFEVDRNKPAHKPFTLRMKAGNTYILHSLGNDPTGTRIRSISDGNHGRKKIAVFAASISMTDEVKSMRDIDAFCQQLFPVRLWGQEYVSTPLINRGELHTYKVVAAYCNTKVSINNAAPVTIGPGEFIQFDSKAACHIVADKPIAVAQYFHKSWDRLKAEPATVMLVPVEQGVKEAVIFSEAHHTINDYSINIVMPTAHTASFRLDGAPVTFTPVPSNAAFSYAVQPVSAGRHSLKANAAFNAVTYGTIMDRRWFAIVKWYGYAIHGNIVNDRNQQISFDADLQCGDRTISFSAQTKYPVLSWLWHFGDGNTSTEQFPTHTYAEPGNYDVTLTTVGNDLYNCNSEISTSITLDIAPKATTTIAAENTCIGNAISFTASSTPATGPTAVTEWEWHLGDGTTSNEQNPTHTYQTAATYTVKLLTRTAAGCTDEILLPNVTVYPLPVADFAAPIACQLQTLTFKDQSTVADGSAITSWLWEFGDGATSSEQHPSHTYPSAGDYQVSLTITSQNGCVKKTTKSLVVHPLAQAQFELVNTCLSQQVIFTNTTTTATGITYSWDFGDGTTSALASPSHTYPAANTYTVTLTATTKAGCTTTQTKAITIYPEPKADFLPVSVCETTRFTFEDKSTITSGTITGWHWDFGDGTTSTLQHPAHTYQAAGTYRVRLEVTSDKGCKGKLEQDVTAHPLLTASAGEDQLLPYGNPSTALDANVPASGRGTWTIVSGRGGAFSDVHDPKATFTGEVGQTYVLRWLVQGSGCSDAMDEVRISLSVVLAEHLKIPNAFSPNGDGINDTWLLEGIDAFDGVQVKVFNRWGDEVFRSKGYSTPWNGTRNGSSLPDGAYYYVIDAGLGAAEVVRGSVTMLR